MKTNACMSSLAELSLESAKWKLKFISAYFRRSFSFKNNDRTCGSLWMHLTHLKGMNVTVLFQQLMVLNNTLYLFFFFYMLLHRPEKSLFFLLYGNLLLLWLVTAQQNVLFGECMVFCVRLFSLFFLI